VVDKISFTQIDLHDIINDSTKPYFFFITQQIATFLSMKIFEQKTAFGAGQGTLSDPTNSSANCRRLSVKSPL